MINLDDRILDQASAEELYFVLRIAKYMDENNFAFPKMKTLVEKTGWGIKKVRRIKDACVEKQFISVVPQYYDNGGRKEDGYYIETDYIKFFVSSKRAKTLGAKMGSTHLAKKDTTPPAVLGSTLGAKMGSTKEVLTNEVLTNEVLIEKNNKKEILISEDQETEIQLTEEEKARFQEEANQPTKPQKESIKNSLHLTKEEMSLRFKNPKTEVHEEVREQINKIYASEYVNNSNFSSKINSMIREEVASDSEKRVLEYPRWVELDRDKLFNLFTGMYGKKGITKGRLAFQMLTNDDLVKCFETLWYYTKLRGLKHRSKMIKFFEEDIHDDFRSQYYEEKQDDSCDDNALELWNKLQSA